MKMNNLFLRKGQETDDEIRLKPFLCQLSDNNKYYKRSKLLHAIFNYGFSMVKENAFRILGDRVGAMYNIFVESYSNIY